VPKQFNDATNFYDQQTITAAKRIKNKRDLKQYIYERWKNKDDFLRYAKDRYNPTAPINIQCKSCYKMMTPSDPIPYQTDTLFSYTCPDSTHIKRMIFSNGMEYNKAVVISEEMQYIYDSSKIVPILKADRRKYCLTDNKAKETKEYVLDKVREDLLFLADLLQQEKADKKEEQLKILLKEVTYLSIPQLDQTLREQLSQLEFINYESIPQLTTTAHLLFSITCPISQSEQEAMKCIEQAIASLVRQTNWRLVQTQYRLGIMTGKLKAYESNNELLTLLTKERI
jgi:hypothetical protein